MNNERIVVSPNKTLKQCIIGFGLPYDRRKSAFIFKKAQQVFLQCQDLKRKGPASLDIVYVSCGRLDGYFELDLQPWDFAAGILILEEAGGRISDWTGLSLPINRRTNVIASNRHIHELLINAIDIQHINKVAGLSAHRIRASYRQS